MRLWCMAEYMWNVMSSVAQLHITCELTAICTLPRPSYGTTHCTVIMSWKSRKFWNVGDGINYRISDTCTVLT